MFKKSIVFFFFLSLIFALNNPSFAGIKSKSKQSHKNKICPIYFYENTDKKTVFNKADKFMQEKKYNVSMYYPEHGFMHIKNNDTSILIKQFGNDAYLLIYPPEKKQGNSPSGFSKDIVSYITGTSKNEYPIIDEYFYRQLEKDIKLIKETRKSCIQEDTYNPDVYTFSVKRYVGYKKYKGSKYDKLKNKAEHKLNKQYYKEKENKNKSTKKQEHKEKSKNTSDL